MKRTLLFTAALGAAVGAFTLGAAQAQGPAGNGNGGGGQSGGQVILPQKNATQSKSQNRETYEYRNEYRYGDDEYEYGMPSNYREEVRNMNQAREQWKKMDDVASSLRAEGYQISKIEMERYGYEAKVRDRDGRRLELKLDPISGKVIGSELD